jgi:hypothetical protein
MFRECSMVEWLGGGVGCLILRADSLAIHPSKSCKAVLFIT